ncbi:vacuolar protein sorting-associated protein 60.2-like [Diospyros lotus]|uniref:vacuolar protein sorting-associated protein 60.2-like n=1 Tax=Diospyros lotus TaxID=55363 RepID=UPI0022505E5D|nr:vacuolar protein sorting-associated protein 60.2-like [Diospyros lotus]XP_052186545.1 vacuolar protein sorting-associated protein 60.2-like [Diospyros lotus]XP_052186546.1 vacuolar protein sorting-associated protein 60.2-like [Diospyros lotus]
MSALKSANKELKGMMKTVKIQDIDSLRDEMMDLMDISNEIQESLGRSYNELMGELDALEADMGTETEGDRVPANLQPDLELELNFPSATLAHAAVPSGSVNTQEEDEWALPAGKGRIWVSHCEHDGVEHVLQRVWEVCKFFLNGKCPCHVDLV